jgi:hypothetical protein
VVVAAFFLSRQRDVKRMFAYSSIEHMGLMTFAFGMGGRSRTSRAAAHDGALAGEERDLLRGGPRDAEGGTQVMEDIRGLIKVSPTVGWGLMLGTLAILGMPPFGVFASEFLILTTAMREHRGRRLPAARAGRGLRRGLRRVQPMVFGDTRDALHHQPRSHPVFIHLGLALMLGLYIPPISPRGTTGGSGCSADEARYRFADGAGYRRDRCRVARAAPVERRGARVREPRAAVALWGADTAQAALSRVRAYALPKGSCVPSSRCPARRRYPTSRDSSLRRRMQRAVRDLLGFEARCAR